MKIFISTVLMLSALGCSQAEFAGVPAPGSRHEDPPAGPTTTQPSSNPADPTPAGPGSVPTPGTSNTPGPGIIDAFTNWINNLTADKPNQIDFGELGKVFHIGDSRFEDSSCKLGIILKVVKGTQFKFTFKVLSEQTNAVIQVGSVCGVDYNINTAILSRVGGPELQKITLQPGQRDFAFQPTVLQTGDYVITVTSPVYDPNGIADRDNFKIGRVRVNADKPIQKISEQAIP